MPVLVRTDDLEWTEVGRTVRTGSLSRKLLRESDVLPGVGCLTQLVRYGKGEESFATPPHCHEYEQIRLCLKGRMEFGPDISCGQGDVGYFPAGTVYGPQSADGAEILLMQWSDTWITREQTAAAITALGGLEAFIDGKHRYTGSDGLTHERDSLHAIWEQVHGRRPVFPRPRYTKAIVMKPEAFSWQQVKEGLAMKQLGRYTERDVTIAMYRWSASASIELNKERTQMMFVLQGRVRLDGHSAARHTVIWSDYGEQMSAEGEAGSTIMYFGFPTPLKDIR